MKILITNDDSISAPGIAVLARAASALGEVTVVAPREECSAMSQKLTLREKLVLERVHNFPVPVKGAYSLSGTPVDCVKVALDCVLEETPDLVLSGINNGYNAGYDIAYSGTLGAAFEAARHNIPAIAFSVAANSHLPAVETYLPDLIRQLMEKKLEQHEVWNVNFPPLNRVTLQGILWDCPVAPVSMYREKYLREERADGTTLLTCQGIPTPDSDIPEGSDAWAVRHGCISVSKVTGTGR